MDRNFEAGASEHHVQLFDSSKSMVDTVAAFLLSGFERRQPILVVATGQHRELLSRRLESNGINVHDAKLCNRLVMLDAAVTLDLFMRQDTPNPVAFDEVIGTIVARLSAGRRVRIYGEMVDVLAARGCYKAAHKLEELWNAFGHRESLDLFCGYASGHFGDPKTAKLLGAICAAHSQVHRKAGDLLAEFLLEQPDVKSARGAASLS